MTDEAIADPIPAVEPPAPFLRRRVGGVPVAGIAVLLLVLVALGVYGIVRATAGPGVETVKGAMQLGVTGMTGVGTGADGNFLPGDPCVSGDGYGDIASGAEVDVVDTSGKVLATGALGDGHAGAGGFSCDYLFKVKGVPSGQSLYGVKVGNANRGVVHFTPKQMQDGPVLSLG